MISHIKGHPQLIALLLALLVYTCWSVSDALVKLATDEGAAPSIVLMFNGMFAHYSWLPAQEYRKISPP